MYKYNSVTFAGESAIHEACSKFNTSQFQAERGAFQENLRATLVNKYDFLGTDITDLQVTVEKHVYYLEWISR